MRLILLLLAFSFGSTAITAQLNATLRDQLTYSQTVNDIWGYVAPDGTEYAIVGTVNGVSFVSLADPDNIQQVAFVPGQFSEWRDMKTYGEYAYSVADNSNTDEGITAYDLSDLPNSVRINRTTYDFGNFTFERAHNLYIDTLDGVLITAGGSRDFRDGGPIFFDLKNTPMEPEFVAFGPAVYSHDVFVLNDTLYASELYRGDLALYDVSDYTNAVRLGNVETPFSFTHNAWSTANGRYVYTTDEKPNASVAAYDVLDKTDIQLTDEYRPFESLNTGTIPHNVHVIDEYLSISYYTDGLRVVDASKPDNLIEVANYDTWQGEPGDFNGNWGAYPFLPSGLTLVSDLSTGLYVVDVDYKRAARLEGVITDEEFGSPVNNVSVVITSDQGNQAFTDALGRYKTGLADGGTYTVTLSAPNYEDLVTDVELINGEITILDTFLTTTVDRFTIDLTVLEEVTETPIPGARVRFVSDQSDEDFLSGPRGQLTRRNVFVSETYTVFVTSWGHRTVAIENVTSEDLQNQTIFLARGYMDDFVTDLGWRVTESSAVTGLWERADPFGTFLQSEPIAPDNDVAEDFGELAWVTGNRASRTIGADDVDDGTVTFESPRFGPINFEDSLVVSYSWWFNNVDRENLPADDSLTISITDGAATALVATYTGRSSDWTRDSFLVNDYVTLNENLQLIVSTADGDPGHWVEAGFDAFNVRPVNAAPVSTERAFADEIAINIYPNPSSESFTLQYDLIGHGNTLLRVIDINGRVVPVRVNNQLRAENGTLRFGRSLPPGLYFVELLGPGGRLYSTKIVKQ